MFQRLIKNDLKENKVSMLVIGLFLLLTLTLSFAATRLTVSLTSSIERFVETAKSPHLLQMHSGSVDQERLQNFVQTLSMWKGQPSASMGRTRFRIAPRIMAFPVRTKTLTFCWIRITGLPSLSQGKFISPFIITIAEKSKSATK